MRLPFTISVTGTSPGPMHGAGPVCASTSATPADVTAVARLLTPAVFRKLRRLTLTRSGFFRNSSFGAMSKPPQRLTDKKRTRMAKRYSISRRLYKDKGRRPRPRRRLRLPFEDVDELGQRLDLAARGVQNRPPLLQSRDRQLLVFKADPSVFGHLDDHGVHRLDV